MDFDLGTDDEATPEKIKKKKKKKKEKKNKRNRRKSVEDELEGVFSTFLSPDHSAPAVAEPPAAAQADKPSARHAPPAAIITARADSTPLTPVAEDDLSVSGFGDSLLDLLDSPAPRGGANFGGGAEGGDASGGGASDEGDAAREEESTPAAPITPVVPQDDDLVDGWSMSSGDSIDVGSGGGARVPAAPDASSIVRGVDAPAALPAQSEIRPGARRQRGSILFDRSATSGELDAPARQQPIVAAFAPAPAAAALRTPSASAQERAAAATATTSARRRQRPTPKGAVARSPLPARSVAGAERASPAATARAAQVRDAEIAQLRAEVRARGEEVGALQRRHARALDEQRERLQEGDDSAAARLRARLHTLETQLRDVRRDATESASAVRKSHAAELDALRRQWQDEVGALRRHAQEAAMLGGLADEVRRSASALSDLQTKVAGDSATTHGAREAQLDAREAALSAAQSELHAQQKRASEEANRLESSLLRVERDAAGESSRRAEQNVRLSKEHARLEVLQKSFTEEAELLRAGVAEDRKDLRERVARFEEKQSRSRTALAREHSVAEQQLEEASGAAARRENDVAAREEAVKEEKQRVKQAAAAVHKRDAELRRLERAMEKTRSGVSQRKHAVRAKELAVDLDEKRLQARHDALTHQVR